MKLFLTGCGLIFFLLITIAQSNPPLQMEPYTFVSRAGDTVAAELGTLTVPENRAAATGKTLKLRFVRFKSTNPRPGAPIVYLAGGPGGSGVGAARGSRFPLFLALREIGDVIAFDQRGTGMSDKPVAYEPYWQYPSLEPLDSATFHQVIGEYTRQAAAFWRENGVDLSAYNTNESADDLNDLRRALGADKLSLWSISYGTHLALATMRRHGDHLDKVILAGVEGPAHTVKLPGSVHALLVRIDSLLKADPKAREAYPDFLGDVARLLAKVEREPGVVKTTHPVTKEPLEVQVGPYDLQILLSSLLRGPELFYRMPYEVQRMLNGDFSGLTPFVLFPRGGALDAMSLAMDVASGISPERLRQLKAEAGQTLLSDAINAPYFAWREALPGLDLGEEFRTPVVSDLPVLCISGTLDGRTAPENAEEVLRTLPNGRHLVIDGAGHSDPLFLSDPQILTTMLRFLRGEAIPDRTIQLPPVEWYVGGVRSEE